MWYSKNIWEVPNKHYFLEKFKANEILGPLHTVALKKSMLLWSPILERSYAMFPHVCPLAVKAASTPWRLLLKRTWTDRLSTY